MGALPTVMVQGPDGGTQRINASDYDPTRHVLVGAASATDLDAAESRGSDDEAPEVDAPPSASGAIVSPPRRPGRPRKVR